RLAVRLEPARDTGNYQFLHIGSPFHNLEGFNVTIEKFYWILGGESVGAEDFHCLISRLDCRFRSKKLRNGRLHLVGQSLVLEARSLVYQELSGMVFHHHFCYLPLYELK